MGSPGIGYLAVAIASVCFGSNFIPVKRYETYDGMFYQWVMCADPPPRLTLVIR